MCFITIYVVIFWSTHRTAIATYLGGVHKMINSNYLLRELFYRTIRMVSNHLHALLLYALDLYTFNHILKLISYIKINVKCYSEIKFSIGIF